MRDGICPKCGSDEIYRGQRIGLYKSIVIALFTTAIPHIYVCTACGYFEQYIEKHKHLEKIKQNWHHVNSESKRKNDER